MFAQVLFYIACVTFGVFFYRYQGIPTTCRTDQGRSLHASQTATAAVETLHETIHDKTARPDIDYFEALSESTGLPHEIVLSILDAAEVWQTIKASETAEGFCRVSNGRKVACRSDQLTALGRKNLRRVIFHIESKDQGWSSGSPQHKGTFEGSWTWFEAIVMKPDGTPQSIQDLIPRVELQRNRHAGLQYESYRIALPCDSPLLEDLTEQNIICLVACAQFPGWVNHVRKACIEYEFFHPFSHQQADALYFKTDS